MAANGAEPPLIRITRAASGRWAVSLPAAGGGDFDDLRDVLAFARQSSSAAT
jgi:hypothetical protein